MDRFYKWIWDSLVWNELGGRCVVSGHPADCIHEIVPKSQCRLWYLPHNRVTLCNSCHNIVHSEGTRKWANRLLRCREVCYNVYSYNKEKNIMMPNPKSMPMPPSAPAGANAMPPIPTTGMQPPAADSDEQARKGILMAAKQLKQLADEYKVDLSGIFASPPSAPPKPTPQPTP